MTELTIKVEDLSDEGLNILATKLCGLADDTAQSWSTVGPLLESHHIELSYKPDENLWEAYLKAGPLFADAQNPRVAVVMLLVKKRIETLGNQRCVLQMPFRRAEGMGWTMTPGMEDLESRILQDVGPEDLVELEVVPD